MIVAAPRVLSAQERGAIALGEAVLGLGVNTRVLMIGAHPDDEDTFLISWLSRGRQVETAYLSLTRGDGGQNLIGNELGEALGVVRTEELLAARRVDGAKQFFTRAYDFGFSKNVEDTYTHWPKDSILGDMVRIVRAFRPHVIVAVFSGTPRDGHGHHQVSGLLAREVFDLAGDTVRFPRLTFDEPWTPLKFYRAGRSNPDAGALRINVGEYSPLLGRSYAEVAGESRSQHKSQGFGSLQRRGPIFNHLRLEASRVSPPIVPTPDGSPFDGIDTSWARFRPSVIEPRARSALDSLPRAFAAARAAYDPLAPQRLVAPLLELRRLLAHVCTPARDNACGPEEIKGASHIMMRNGDLWLSLAVADQRVDHALRLASGVDVDAFAVREVVDLSGDERVITTIYNRGADTVGVSIPAMQDDMIRPLPTQPERRLAPGAVLVDTLWMRLVRPTQPAWLMSPRVGALFTQPVATWWGETSDGGAYVSVALNLGRGADRPLWIGTPVVFMYADQIKGEVRRVVAGVPKITVTLDRAVQYAPANVGIDRPLNVRLRSADDGVRDMRVTLVLPSGLTADSVTRTIRLAGHDAHETVTFRLRGKLAPGTHQIAALAESDGEVFASGYELIDYDHIRRRRIYRPALTALSAVDVRVPSRLRVAYVPGVGDNVAPALVQLGVPVTVIPAQEIASADLQSYTTVVVGPRAYETHPELVAANARLLDFARHGGTVVVQYGQYEMMQPGIMPYAITIPRPHDRVTHEDAPVTIIESGARELSWPNRVAEADFAGWVQERALYMPRTFDQRYRPLLAINDPGEPPNRGAILVAPVGEGRYIYTTLAFFRQLPAGVPGAARLFVNLMSAGVAPSATP